MKTTTDGRRLAGEATRARLLAAASEALAESGESGVSLRGVSGDACANVAAISYYFGSREGLLRAVIVETLQPAVSAQLAAFAALPSPTGPDAVADLVAAWATPLLATLVKPEAQTARIMARMLGDHASQLRPFVYEVTNESRTQFIALLRRAIPGLSLAEARLRLAVMTSAIVGLASGNFDQLLAPSTRCQSLGDGVLRLLTAIAAAPVARPSTRKRIDLGCE